MHVVLLLLALILVSPGTRAQEVDACSLYRIDGVRWRLWNELYQTNDAGDRPHIKPFGWAMWALIEARRADALRYLEQASGVPLTPENRQAAKAARTLLDLERRCNPDGALPDPPRRTGIG
ncbi:MAG: hypothetical protein ACLGIM_06385 [Alphaproteobacteria bacterium]